MSERDSRFGASSPRSTKSKAAGAAIACAVMLLAGCGTSGEAESGAPVIRGDAPVAADATLTVSNTTTTGTVGTPITLTSAGGSATDNVSFTTTTTGCTAIGASLSATTAGPCVVTATQVTQTSPAVTFTFTAAAAADAATSAAGVPSSPLNPRLTSTGPTTMTVWFDAPSDNGSVITSYKATSLAGAFTGTVTGAASSSGIPVAGLTTGETYSFKVTATNAVGTSAGSYTTYVRAGSGDCNAPASANVNWAYCDKTDRDLSWTDLTDANLTGATLNMTDLGAANLTGANLTGASINGAKVNAADFTDANLTDVKLQSTYISGADFTRANLTRANLTCLGSCSDLLQANLTDANLTDAQLKGAKLNKVNLTNANLTKADLTGVQMTGADLTGANLTGADLTGVTWSGATCPNKLKGPYPCSLSTPVTVAPVTVATVTFNPNDGDGSIASQSATGATLLTANNGAIKRTGFVFNGWATTPTGSMAYADGATYPFTASATLYARWGCLPLTVTASAERLTKDRAKVKWTASSSESPWTTFTVTTVGGWLPITVSQSSNTGSKTATGLMQFQSYTFTVKATNEAGCSYTSAQTNRVAAVN